MGCNCRKAKKPAGYGIKPKAPESPSPAAPPPGQSFTLTDGMGRTQTFGSRLERDAALRRLGLKLQP